MTWYAAHIIISTRPIKPRKGKILVYENVILLQATDGEEATDKAREYADASIIKDDKLTTMDGEPAVESFVGIRKIIEVRNPWPLSPDNDRPVDGTEITYSKFKLKDERALSKLVNGEEVLIDYLE
jgi:hypothetical protein